MSTQPTPPFLERLAKRFLVERGYEVSPSPMENDAEEVFAEISIDDYRKMPRAQAKHLGHRVLRCTFGDCRRAACQVDRLHPYHAEYTLCEKHRNITRR